MIIQVCRGDGVVIGRFDEAAFRDKLQRGELPTASGQYSYWHDGMTEWKPLAEYRPPGKITSILENIPTREARRRELKSASGASESEPAHRSMLKKLKGAFRPNKPPSR